MRSPADAPPRPDLAWLRHRARPAATPSSQALSDFMHGADHPRHRHADAAPTSSSLDLSAPSTPAPSPALAPAPASPAGSSSSLDLSGAESLANAPFKPTPAPVRAYLPPRVRAGTATVLTAKAPTVTLTRVQSGVGSLLIEAACSPAVGDLRLGAAYQLGSGPTSVVQRESGVTTAPPGSRRPVIIGQRGQFEKLTVDLVQVRDLARFVVYAYSASGGVLNWGGTLVLTTFGQSRIEMPLDRTPSPGVFVLASVFVVDGEMVIRWENEEIAGTVRDAALAYGFDKITWLDTRTPLV
ncbi:MAG: hypothetical protein QOJ83_2249 [Frankiales bacterium]|nr:hypothetical protein [Frankiales bacterium]